MNITDTVSEKMSDIFKPQRKFISALLTTIMLMRGFNGIGIEMLVPPHAMMIAIMDCSFIPEYTYP